MRSRFDNLSHRHLVVDLLGMACLLLGTVSGGGQREEELTIKIHVVWTGKYQMNSSQGSASGQMNDSITIIYDGVKHAQAPPGTQPWDMTSGDMDEHVTVSGGGSGTLTGKDEKGVVSTYSQSWTYVLKDTPHNLGGGIWLGPSGSFQVSLPSLQGINAVPKIQGDHPTDLRGSVNAIFGAIALTPGRAQGGFPAPGSDPSFPNYDANFWAQLKGAQFEPKSRSFSKSGSGKSTQPAIQSTGAIPGITDSYSGSLEASYSLNFNQEPEELEAILIPEKDYDDWMPQAGENEDKPGKNPLIVQVVLQKKGQSGKKPKGTAHFKFELVGTSQQPGVCLNWPPKDKAKTDFDLKIDIDKDQNSKLQVDPDSNGQRATSDSGLQESAVTVVSHDWGAWGTLKVTAVLDDDAHTEVVAHLKDQPNTTALSIPKDDNGNHIADAWENDEAPPSTDAKSDDDDSPHNDSPPGDGHNGDGLSLYEEYRGFRIQGAYKRTSPTQKDVFIFDRNKLGRGYFGMSHLQVHFIKHEEFTYEQGGNPNPRVINFNSGYAHLGSEHVIEMLNGYAEGRLGVTEGGPNVPKNIHHVIIDKAYCMASRWKEKEVAQNIAHELGHATNVHHHGEDNYYVNSAGEHYISPKLCGGPMKGGGEVAVQGGQNSGAEECVMRYIRAAYFDQDQGGYCWQEIDENRRPIGPLKRGEVYGPSQMPGTTFCTSNLGTGINSGRYTPSSSSRHVPNLGNATLGGCSLQFCVNDMKH